MPEPTAEPTHNLLDRLQRPDPDADLPEVELPCRPRPKLVVPRPAATKPAPRPQPTGGLKSRLGQRFCEEREASSLCLVFVSPPPFYQLGNFLRVLSNGETTSTQKNRLHHPGGPPSLLLLDRPRAELDLAARTFNPELQVILLSPLLGRYYRFTKLSALALHSRAGGDQHPLLRVTSFPALESKLAPCPGLLGRLHALSAEPQFDPLEFAQLAAAEAVHQGGSAYAVDYWLDRNPGLSSALPPFEAEQLECVWSGDREQIARQLSSSLEVGLSYQSGQPLAEKITAM